MGRPKTGKDIICPNCGKIFYATKQDLAQIKTHTCSKYCMGQVRRGKERPPEVGLHISLAKRGKPLTEDHKKKLSDAHKGQIRSPEALRKSSESLRSRYTNNKEFRDKIQKINSERNKSLKYRELARRRSLKMWADPAHIDKIYDKISGENCHLWRGGISFEPYCKKFNNLIKEKIRDNFGRVCFVCGKSETENGKRLDVHHVDYSKEQGCDRQWSLVPLCHPCHSRTNGDRVYWEALLRYELCRGGRNGVYEI